MTIVLCPCFGAGAQFFDLNGDPLSGGLLSSYLAGTTTPTPTWTSYLGTTANTNPIVLDAEGRVVEEIWIDVALQYKFVLTDALAVQIWEHDYINWYVPPDTDMASLANATDPALGDNLIGFQQSDVYGNLTGAVEKTVHDKFQEIVSVKDFGAVGDGTTDDTDAILLATQPGRCVQFPAGTYVVSAPMDFTNMDNIAWVGGSAASTIINAKAGVVFNAPMVTATNGDRWLINNIIFNWNNNPSFTTTSGQGMLWLREMWHLDFTNNIVLHDNRGLFLRACKFFEVSGNEFIMSVPVLTENYSLHVSDVDADPGSLSEYGVISGNVWTGSGSFFAGKSFVISDNVCANSKFGAGINTWSSETKQYIGHVITGNLCRDNIGKDAAGPVRGMEILGQYHQVSANQCHGNGGPGIAWFGFKGICASNVCWDNGTEPTGSAGQKAGIFALAGGTTLSTPNGSLITGNRCFTAGGYQDYGFVETSGIDAMTVSGNDFSGNLLGQTLLAVNPGNIYDLDQWIPYTPTVTATTGAITTFGAVVGNYMRRGLLVFYNVYIEITTNGTGAGELSVSLPLQSNSNMDSFLNGKETAISFAALNGYIAPTSNTMLVTDYLGAYPAADGCQIILSGSYAR